ncbi:MAG: ATP-binding protein, partial [Atribacterota bacterium]
EEIKDKIFDYFFTTKRNAGTGLGLALTYEMIKRHNGRIEVESKVGEGTTFSVYLPVVGSS